MKRVTQIKQREKVFQVDFLGQHETIVISDITDQNADDVNLNKILTLVTRVRITTKAKDQSKFKIQNTRLKTQFEIKYLN